MHLARALEIGESSLLLTVGEAIENITARGNMLLIGDPNEELKQLNEEWHAVKNKTSYSDGSMIEVVYEYLMERAS